MFDIQNVIIKLNWISHSEDMKYCWVWVVVHWYMVTSHNLYMIDSYIYCRTLIIKSYKKDSWAYIITCVDCLKELLLVVVWQYQRLLGFLGIIWILYVYKKLLLLLSVCCLFFLGDQFRVGCVSCRSATKEKHSGTVDVSIFTGRTPFSVAQPTVSKHRKAIMYIIKICF